MHICPTCNGSKEITSTVTKLTSSGSSSKPFTCVCITCAGTGKLSNAELITYHRMMNKWCMCEEDTPVEYIDNGVDPECLKHHYKCKVCGKVAQTG